jgi:sugar (pentulose or hexulose) kinase
MSLAVFDLGKTNSKMFVLARDGAILHQSRTKPVWIDHHGRRVLDDAHLFDWMNASLVEIADRHDVTGVMFSGHGCTFALVRPEGLTHPVLDYEQDPPLDIAAAIDADIPSFSETFSPALPLGFNYGRHLLWLAAVEPDAVSNAEWILSYPQYWSWRFSGAARSEVSYLGCHSHLWAPLADDFSTLVRAQGWEEKMPPFARAGAPLGSYPLKTPTGDRQLVVHNGVHDSNSALYLYRALGLDDFTLVSSGTWVIIFNTACPLQALDERRDMLANVTVDRNPVATIRFMGGREYDLISQGWTAPISLLALESVIDKSIFALPSFAPGGPFQRLQGQLIGPQPTPEERGAAALLYVALMTDLSLDLVQSSNDLVVDGGLVKTGLYGPLLAQLRHSQNILSCREVEGSALGAAALAMEDFDVHAAVGELTRSQPLALAGLEAYRKKWREHIAAEEREDVA